MPARRVAAAVAVVGALAFVVLAVLLVPWDPIPGGPLHPPSASSVFTAEQIQRAEDYSGTQRLLSWASLAVSLAVACVLGFSRLGSRFVDRVRGPWWWRVVVAVVALALAGRVATLPFSIVLRHRALEFGLTNQAWSAYAVDLAKGLAVGVVATSIALVVLVGVARRWPRAWPAAAGLLLAGLVMLGSFVYPLLVEPLFNHFEPLPDGPLRTQVLALADQEGVQVDDVLVADASRRTTTLNAYVSGFGSSRRVVVYDNLVDGVDRRPRDPLRRRPRAGPCAPRRRAHRLAARRGRRAARRRPARAAGRGTRVAWPTRGRCPGCWRCWRSRRCSPARWRTASAGASRPGPTWPRCEATDDPEAFIEVQKELALTSLADPTPYAWSQFWFGSHPTTLQRIALAERFAADRPRRNAVTPQERLLPRGEGVGALAPVGQAPMAWSSKMSEQLRGTGRGRRRRRRRRPRRSVRRCRRSAGRTRRPTRRARSRAPGAGRSSCMWLTYRVDPRNWDGAPRRWPRRPAVQMC